MNEIKKKACKFIYSSALLTSALSSFSISLSTLEYHNFIFSFNNSSSFFSSFGGVTTISLIIGIAIGSSEVIGVAESAGDPGTTGLVKTFFSSLAGAAVLVVVVVFLFWVGLSHGKRTSDAPYDLSESNDGVGDPCLS